MKDKFANLTQEQKEREAVDLANIFSKMSNGALRPMAIDKDGKLKPVEESVVMSLRLQFDRAIKEQQPDCVKILP